MSSGCGGGNVGEDWWWVTTLTLGRFDPCKRDHALPHITVQYCRISDPLSYMHILSQVLQARRILTNLST